jgi:hypothetical protein
MSSVMVYWVWSCSSRAHHLVAGSLSSAGNLLWETNKCMMSVGSQRALLLRRAQRRKQRGSVL